MALGCVQAHAFPNVGVNLKQVIEKQNNATEQSGESQAFKFGILGSVEFESISHRFQDNWQRVLARIEDESAVYEQCSASATGCPPKVRQWRNLIQSLKGQPAEEQLKQLNKSINKMAKYADDDKIFGKRDYWATPLEFLKGRADCEDYAVVKFWSLLELGYRDDQLRLAIVRDQRRGIMHAVVTVALGERTIVLDNLFDHPVEQRHILKYAPIFSANLDSDWVHIVTRKIRVSYINSLKYEDKRRVIPVRANATVPIAPKAPKAPTKAVTPAAGLLGLAALKAPAFVDWT